MKGGYFKGKRRQRGGYFKGRRRQRGGGPKKWFSKAKSIAKKQAKAQIKKYAPVIKERIRSKAMELAPIITEKIKSEGMKLIYKKLGQTGSGRARPARINYSYYQ